MTVQSSVADQANTAPAWRKLLSLPAEARARVLIHLVGIGGAGLSAIARLLLGRGYRVSGSDRRPSPATEELAELGATIFFGHDGRQVQGASLALISSAVPADNPEVVAAQAAGIPVVKRKQFLGPLMAGYDVIAVAGTHGKTTTSALLAQWLDAAGAEPSFIIGSEILSLGCNARNGRPGGPFVIEADEYDGMFLGLRPRVAVVTNVEWDHMDCYPDPASYHQAFRRFAQLAPANGAVIYCGDDSGARQLQAEAGESRARWISYGIEPGNHWQAVEIVANRQGGSDFAIQRGDGRLIGPVSCPLPGLHNVKNLLAALAAAAEAGYDFTKLDENLKISSKFTGTARRLEQKGKCCDIIILDDYAHHPTEVRATLSAARQRFPGRAIWVLFQPHTFSRTQALLNDFCNSFENADHVLITDIYAAREHMTMDITSHDLVNVLQAPADVRYTASLQAASDTLLAELQPGDLLLTLGAGDSYQVGEAVLAGLRRRLAARTVFADSHARHDALSAAIEQVTGLAVRRNEPLAGHTTMRIGGPADLFVSAASLDDLVAIVRLAGEYDVPYWILGGGSNVLISDRGIRGLVIANHCRALRRHEGDIVWAESGVNLAGLARQTLRWGLAGLEWGVSVPGTVGGAIVGNAGAHGSDIASNLLRVTLLMPDGRIAEWPAARLNLAYRSSLLKERIRAGQPAPLVLSAAFQLAPADRAELEARAARFLAHRRATQPVEASAGSVFQNPPGDYAGRILESLGLKGHRQGGAAISIVHANFIVNLGDASAQDVAALINEARQAVWQAMGIELKLEILFVGDWNGPSMTQHWDERSASAKWGDFAPPPSLAEAIS